MRKNQILFFILLFILLSNIISLDVLAQNDFIKVFENKDFPSRNEFRINFIDKDSTKSVLPIVLLKGKKEGPVFTIIAGVHGFEYPPIIAVQSFLKEVDLIKLKGTLVVIPIANSGAFYQRTPFINPEDGLNLNSAFPGKVGGYSSCKYS